MASSSSSSPAAGGDDERIEGFFRRRAAAAHASASSAAPPPSALLSVRRERAPVAPAQQSQPPQPQPQPQLALLDLAFDRSLAALLFACGDALEPRADTRELLRVMALQHLETLTHLALDVAAAGGAREGRAQPASAAAGAAGGGASAAAAAAAGAAPPALGGGGHTLEPAHVVQALREAGHGHAEAAERVRRGVLRRRELDRLLRVDLGRGEEESCFSRRREEQPADVSSAGAAAQLRAEVARRYVLDALVAEGAVEAVPEGAQDAFRARRDAERQRAAAAAAGGARKRGRGSGDEDDDDDGGGNGGDGVEEEEDEDARNAREVAEARAAATELRERLATTVGSATAAVGRQLAAAEAKLKRAEERVAARATMRAARR
jgi:hypothetical protein